jgi:hypothetical protein
VGARRSAISRQLSAFAATTQKADRKQSAERAFAPIPSAAAAAARLVWVWPGGAGGGCLRAPPGRTTHAVREPAPDAVHPSSGDTAQSASAMRPAKSWQPLRPIRTVSLWRERTCSRELPLSVSLHPSWDTGSRGSRGLLRRSATPEPRRRSCRLMAER